VQAIREKGGETFDLGALDISPKTATIDLNVKGDTMKRELNKHHFNVTRSLLALFFLISFILPNATAIAADKVIKWRLQAFWPSSSSSYKQAVLSVVEQVKERTNGRLIIQPYGGNALVPTNEILTAVERGMIEIGVASGGYYRDKIPIGGIAFGLPFSFRNYWEVAYFHHVLGFEEMLRKAYAEHGVWYCTESVLASEIGSKKPLRTMADFKGLKIRSYGVNSSFLSSIGASPVNLHAAEIYPALASGVIDAEFWGGTQAQKDMGFYDVCKYHLKTKLCLAGTIAYMVNQKAIDKLPEDIQSILYSTIKEHFWLRFHGFIYGEIMATEKIQKEDGVTITTLSPEEQNKMSAAAMKIWDKEAKKNEDCAKAVQMMKTFLGSLGYL
jgi:TRAP-type mannitol/chloroaromatic compound transport system substrate-binding protein